MIMSLSGTIRFREEDFGGIVFRKEDNFFVQLNKAGYQIFKLLNEKENDSEEIKIKFPEFFNFVKSLNMLSDCSNQTKERNKTCLSIIPLEKRLKEGFLRSPLETSIEITSKCQLKCSHCYGAFTNKSKDNELSYSEITSLVDQLAKIGVFAVFVGGGEPTIHPHFFDICKYILSKDINVVVSTNGIDLNKEKALQFQDLGAYIGVQISLEGPNHEINDRMRGNGSFDKALSGLKNLQSVGLNPTLGCTITKANYESLEGMIKLSQLLNIPHIHFMGLMPSGRGDLLYEKLRLSQEQKKHLAIQIKDLKEKYKGLIGVDCANFFQQPPSKEFDPNTSYDNIDKIYAGCEASRVRCTVTSEGNVVGCEIMRDYIAGNVREKSFLDIWENSDVFNFVRSRKVQTLEGKCNSCKYVAACVGDCPSYSLHKGKSFFVGGEECPHSPENGNYIILG